jgi:peptide/nickel transport system ATP-binding protein
MTIGAAVGHPLSIHGVTSDEREADDMVAEALERVGLAPAEQFMSKYPGDLSGGQKQRAVLARAIILGPDLLVADEPVSMLDMSVRAKILELMLALKRDLDLTYIYITHDLATAKFFCDRIAIMYLGRVVEMGPSAAIYENPKHPYTVALLKAIPDPDPRKSVPRDVPRGEVPDAVSPPLGCSFHPRCPHAFEVCGWEARDLIDLLEGRWAAMPEEAYEEEQALVGDLGAFEWASYEIELPAGRSAGELVEFLEKVRAEDPEEPFWKGVRGLEAIDDHVRVVFHEGIDPPLLPEGRVAVACHLYDPDALRRAVEYREAPSAQ